MGRNRQAVADEVNIRHTPTASYLNYATAGRKDGVDAEYRIGDEPEETFTGLTWTWNEFNLGYVFNRIAEWARGVRA
jgi:hypothetical protein